MAKVVTSKKRIDLTVELQSFTNLGSAHNSTSKHHVATKSLEVGDWTKLRDLEEPRSRAKSGSDHSNKFSCQEDDNGDGPKLLPFEFVVLEACIEAAYSCLDNEVRTLEKEAHPALDKLISQISTLNLEPVRQIKSRLVAITGRVQKVRDELEHFLDVKEVDNGKICLKACHGTNQCGSSPHLHYQKKELYY